MPRSCLICVTSLLMSRPSINARPDVDLMYPVNMLLRSTIYKHSINVNTGNGTH